MILMKMITCDPRTRLCHFTILQFRSTRSRSFNHQLIDIHFAAVYIVQSMACLTHDCIKEVKPSAAKRIAFVRAKARDVSCIEPSDFPTDFHVALKVVQILTASIISVAYTMTLPSRDEAESQVKSWGFPHVFTWTDRA